MGLHEEVAHALNEKGVRFHTSKWESSAVYELPDPAPAIVPISYNMIAAGKINHDFHQDIWKHWPRAVILWEDIWNSRKSIVMSRIQAYLGKSERIHGRQTNAIAIGLEEAREFLQTNHLMGYTKAKYFMGLKWKDDLVAVATFGRPVNVERSFGPSRSYELIRFCYKLNTHVQGGLTKLMRHFVVAQAPGDIYTSVDREWSDGAGYASIGFKKTGITEPIHFWIDKSGNRFRTEIEEGIQISNAGNLKMVWIPKATG